MAWRAVGGRPGGRAQQGARRGGTAGAPTRCTCGGQSAPALPLRRPVRRATPCHLLAAARLLRPRRHRCRRYHAAGARLHNGDRVSGGRGCGGEGGRGWITPPPSRPLATCVGDSRHTPPSPARVSGWRVCPAAGRHTPRSAVHRRVRLAKRAGRRLAAGVSLSGNEAGLVANGNRSVGLTRDAQAAGTGIARARAGIQVEIKSQDQEISFEPSIQPPDKAY